MWSNLKAIFNTVHKKRCKLFSKPKKSIEKRNTNFSMKLHFLVHHVESKRQHGKVIMRFSESQSNQVHETLPSPCGRERLRGDIISFILDETRDVTIQIQVLDANDRTELATLPLPLSIIPYDFRVNAKFLMDPVNNNEDAIKIFLMMHLSTFGQSPFHAKKGLLLKHLRDATRKKREPVATEYPQERELRMLIDVGRESLPRSMKRDFRSHKLDDSEMSSLLGQKRIEWT